MHETLRFARLTEVAPADLAAHMSDARTVAHMPLASGVWDAARCTAFVAMKEATWARDGLGHWAFFDGADYLGWGGFQKEGAEWDYGLVLRPGRFGAGQRITRRALDFARSDPRIPYVTFLLPPSRRNLGALARLGARQVGTVDYDGATFLKFRLDTD
ncbi:hypothetical protein ATO6_08570 [Oceanicola sp. 22II-s10i]|uniref:GNAT family N-acetyltransferase n=1 Tax=Oceanicola sp. 22II-s10i TaxID=1317116 RepID=UPI000B5252B1|nr:GNAT family N-acetyltransferase [Oceanicola sp. 22II-s10i]OWU85092.1 hypothetical protein ATO6_08570 [Oceanicola sp. 22II-s10i]